MNAASRIKEAAKRRLKLARRVKALGCAMRAELKQIDEVNAVIGDVLCVIEKSSLWENDEPTKAEP